LTAPPVVDAHHHFWDPARASYPWLTDELAVIRRRFGPDDLRPLLRAAGVGRTVVVQTIGSLDETGEFLALAAETDFLAGVVGWADLTDPAVGSTLAALRAGPGGDHLVGVRHQAHDEPDAAWLLRPDVQRGIAAVGEAGLVYDLLVRARELPAALETVRRHPAVTFVIDHIAKPRIAAGPEDRPWAAGIAPFSDQGNAHCKLSGMVTEADWRRWQPADLAPYVRRVVGWFGPERCMFGSDWPVCLLAAPYDRVVAALHEALPDLPPGAGAEVFGGTAARVYKLP
jgi:L-fuconolactonase